MKTGVVLALVFIGTLVHEAAGQRVPIYYDSVENGKLSGGVVMVDTLDAAQRESFKLRRGALPPPGNWPVTTIRDNGPPSNRIDLVILGDGYTQSEMGLYAAHASTVVDAFFSEEPLSAYRRYFNVHRVDVISNESGVDEPVLGIFRDTALDMTFDCAGIARLLCVDVNKAYAAAASAPEFDQILVLANSTRYGGAGYPANDLGTVSGGNGSAVEVALHEFGHSFADLADEYDYADGATYTGVEPADANVSIYNVSDQLAQQRKWWRWMDLGNVGAFEGAAYNQFGIYRPTANSLMRSLGRTFEEINVEQFIKNIYMLVSPIDGVVPSSPITYSACTTFSVVPMQPLDHALDVKWSIDSVDVAGATGTEFTPDPATLSVGSHTVRATVTDTTGRVRDESFRAAWMVQEHAWSITVLGVANECSPLSAPVPELDGVAKQRFVSFSIPLGGVGTTTAIRFELTQLHTPTGPPDAPDFSAFDGQLRYLNAFRDPVTSAIVTDCPDSSSLPPTYYKCAAVGCVPEYLDWATLFGGEVIHATGGSIVPSSHYEVVQLGDVCSGVEPTCAVVSAALALYTAQWGDANGDGLITVNDVTSVVDRVKDLAGALTEPQVLVRENVLLPVVWKPNVLEITNHVDALRNKPYPSGINECP